LIFFAEYCLSSLIEHEGKNILVDAGSSDAFYEAFCIEQVKTGMVLNF